MRRRTRRDNAAPQLGGKRGSARGGDAPILSGTAPPLYGQLRQQGLEAPTLPGRARPLILFALHDESIAALLTLLAESNGYEVRHVRYADEAWDMVHALSPDLVVVSQYLFHATGEELVAALRNWPDPLINRVVIQFLGTGAAGAHRALSRGADDYVTIPETTKNLLAAWRRLIAQPLRPAPLAALLNPSLVVRYFAIELVIPHGDAAVEGLAALLLHAQADIQTAARTALKRIGTVRALAVLEETGI